MKLVLFLLSAGLFCLSAQAEPQTLTHGEFDITVDIETQQVFPGMPLYLYMTIKRHEDGAPEPVEVVFSSMGLFGPEELSITDLEGKSMGERPKEPWYPACAGFVVTQMVAPGETMKKTIIVNQWRSTELPEGKYTLAWHFQKNLHIQSKDKRRKPDPLINFNGKFEFPLVILPRNDDAVRKRFEQILETAVRHADKPTSDKQKFLASDTLIYAQGPLAVPYQLELIRQNTVAKEYDLWPQNRMLEIFRYFAHEGNAETARLLVDFGKSSLFENLGRPENYSFRGGVWEYLYWAIHELNQSGRPELVAPTQALVDQYGKPTLKVNYGYFMDCWDTAEEDY